MGIAILIITGFIAVAASLWIVVIAFQRSVLWGLAVLLVPFAELVFVIMYWQDAKKPFLIMLVASIAMGVSLVMVFPQMNTEQFADVMEGVQSGQIKPNEAFEQYDKQDAPLADGMNAGTEGTTPTEPMAIDETGMPLAMTDKAGDVKAESAAKQAKQEQESAPPQEEEVSPFPSPGKVKPDPLAVKKQKAESPTIRVKLEKIATYKGRYFIITTKDGKQHRGLLKKVSDSSLFMNRKLYGGNFDFVVAKKQVAHLDMLKEEYVKDYMER